MHSWFLSENGSEVFGGLWWSWSSPTGLTLAQQSMTTSWSHTCTCTVLCCAYLKEVEQGHLSQKSTVLLPYGPFLRPHNVLFCSFAQHVLTSNPWLAPWLLVLETCILAPFLLYFLKTFWRHLLYFWRHSGIYMQLTGLQSTKLVLGTDMPHMVFVIQLQPTQLMCLVM